MASASCLAVFPLVPSPSILKRYPSRCRVAASRVAAGNKSSKTVIPCSLLRKVLNSVPLPRNSVSGLRSFGREGLRAAGAVLLSNMPAICILIAYGFMFGFCSLMKSSNSAICSFLNTLGNLLWPPSLPFLARNPWKTDSGKT